MLQLATARWDAGHTERLVLLLRWGLQMLQRGMKCWKGDAAGPVGRPHVSGGHCRRRQGGCSSCLATLSHGFGMCTEQQGDHAIIMRLFIARLPQKAPQNLGYWDSVTGLLGTGMAELHRGVDYRAAGRGALPLTALYPAATDDQSVMISPGLLHLRFRSGVWTILLPDTTPRALPAALLRQCCTWQWL